MKLRTGWRMLAVVLALLAAVAAGSGATAEEATQASGFIVDTGEGEPIYVVVTSDGPVNAIDQLRRADLGVVTVDFGGMGAAVCEIRSTGCDVRTCRQRLCQTGDPQSPFWQYWRQGEDGWRLSPLGAGGVAPGDGDISAWLWIGTKPELDPITWRELAERAGAPAAVASGEVGGDPAIYSSAAAGERDTGSGAQAALAGGVVAVVILAGATLVLRQRRARGSA